MENNDGATRQDESGKGGPKGNPTPDDDGISVAVDESADDFSDYPSEASSLETDSDDSLS